MIRRELLLIRPDKSGDAIKTLPVLRALKPHFTEPIHILCSSINSSLFQNEPEVQTHILPQNWESLSTEQVRACIYPPLPPWFKKAILLPCDPIASQIHLLSSIAAEQRYSLKPVESVDLNQVSQIHFLTLPEGRPEKHCETTNILNLISRALKNAPLNSLPIVSAEPAFSTEDFFEAEKIVLPNQDRLLGICPFAGKQNRSHSPQKWTKFIVGLTEKADFERFFIFGAESDRPLMEKIRLKSGNKEQITVCCPTSFRALGAYMKYLTAVIAVDSGPLHLARALGVPSLGILSGGDYRRWFPTENPGDKTLRRGVFSRFPSLFAMRRAYSSWVHSLFSLHFNSDKVILPPPWATHQDS